MPHIVNRPPFLTNWEEFLKKGMTTKLALKSNLVCLTNWDPPVFVWALIHTQPLPKPSWDFYTTKVAKRRLSKWNSMVFTRNKTASFHHSVFYWKDNKIVILFFTIWQKAVYSLFFCWHPFLVEILDLHGWFKTKEETQLMVAGHAHLAGTNILPFPVTIIW